MAAQPPKGDGAASSTAVTIQDFQVHRACCGCLDLVWLVSTFEGIVKLIQFITTLLSFAILCAAFKTDDVLRYFQMDAKFEFMVFVAVTAWVFVSLHILLKMTHLYEQLPQVFIRPEVGLVLLSVGVFAFLVASSVVLSYSYHWGSLKASAGFGFLTATMLMVEIVYMVLRFTKVRNEATSGESMKMTNNNTSNQPNTALASAV